MGRVRAAACPGQSVALSPGYLFLLWVGATVFVWGFAFAGAPEATPEWLVRARSVCFGMDETGLPDAQGWILLVLAPLTLLASILVAYGPSDVYWSLKALVRSWPGRGIALVLGISLIGVSAYSAHRMTKGIAVLLARQEVLIDDSRLPEAYAPLMRPAPQFNLVNQHGQSVSPHSFHGETVFLSFVFAHCRTVCPVLAKTLTDAAVETEPRAIRIVYVSLDPRRDTPSSLPDIARRWKLRESDMILSGKVEDVEQVLRDYNAGAVRDERTGDVSHPPLVYVMDGQGMLQYAFTNPRVSWLTDAVQRISGRS